MLTHAEPWMVPALTGLWHTCFGDSEEYIAFFMVHRFKPEQTIVWLEGEKAVGVIYLLPCKIDERDALYCYAVGVAPEYRGRGICAAMLSAAEAWCITRDIPLFCAPREGMTGYYHRRGYRDAFFCRWAEYSTDGQAKKLSPVEAESGHYTRLRDQFLPKLGLVRWDEPAVEYALAEHRLYGGFAHILPWKGADYLLLGHIDGRTLVLTETTLPAALLHELAPSLCAHYRGEGLRCRLPTGKREEVTGVCFGSATCNSGWLGLDLT